MRFVTYRSTKIGSTDATDTILPEHIYNSHYDNGVPAMFTSYCCLAVNIAVQALSPNDSTTFSKVKLNKQIFVAVIFEAIEAAH